jgi:hypothetical protein
VAAFTVKVGALKIAVLGLNGALAASGIGAFALALGFVTTQIIKTRREQKELNDAISKGSGEEVTKQLTKQEKALEKIEERLKNANGRTKKSLEIKKKEIEADIRMLEGRNKTLESDKKINEALEKRLETQKESTEEIEKQQEETDKLKDKMTEVGEEIESSIKNNLRESITGAQSFGQAMTNVLNKIRDKIIDAQIDKILGNFGENFGKGASGTGGKGVGGFVGKILGGLFADGGRPPVGKASIVGERGPELFVPKVAGTIIPNNKLGGGDNTTNIVNVSVDASGSSVAGNSADAQQLGAVIGAAVQAQLIKEKRSGGLLAR